MRVVDKVIDGVGAIVSASVKSVCQAELSLRLASAVMTTTLGGEPDSSSKPSDVQLSYHGDRVGYAHLMKVCLDG